MRAWHFLKDNGKAIHGILGVIEVGKTYKIKGSPIPCHHGLHASKRIIDALQFAQGSLLCRVEMGGKITEEPDKVCAQERTVIWMMDITTILHNFACNEAERAILAQTTRDPRSMEAIRVKRLWIKGRATDAELDAAGEAARAAAGAAARAAAGAAAGAAAWEAARAAAGAAAWAAAWEAARAAQNTRLTAMVMRARRKVK